MLFLAGTGGDVNLIADLIFSCAWQFCVIGAVLFSDAPGHDELLCTQNQFTAALRSDTGMC